MLEEGQGLLLVELALNLVLVVELTVLLDK